MHANRITIALVLLIAAQVVFFIAAMLGESRHRWQEASATSRRMAEVLKSSTDDFFHRYLSIFDTLKSVDAFIEQHPEPSGQILSRLNLKYQEIVNFAAVKKDGFFFASGKPLSPAPPPNIKDLEFFQRILAGEGHVIMQPHLGPISKARVTGIAVPLDDPKGEVNGLIGVSIKYQALTSRWDALLANTGGQLAVFDAKGKVIHVSQGLGLDGKDMLARPEFSDSRPIQVGGQNFAVHVVQDRDSGWQFAVFSPTKNTPVHLLLARKDLILLFLLTLTTIGILGIWIAQERQWSAQLKDNQETLRQREELFRQLAENITAAFWISSPDKKTVEYVSPSFETIWEEDCQALYSNPWLWLERIHPEDRQAVQQAAHSKQELGTYDELYRIVRKDQDIRWIHDRAFPLKDDAGKVYRIVGIAQDVSTRVETQEALRRSEEELRSVFDNSVDAIGVSRNGIHTFVNKAFLRMFQYQDVDELIGRPVVDLIAPDEKARIQEFISQRQKGEEIDTFYQTKGLKKDGTVFNMEVTVALYGPQDEKNSLVILRDVTERIRLEEKLRQSQKMEAIGTLAGGIAHDFNNILFPLLGFTEMLLDDLPEESRERQEASQIYQAALRAKELVKQILTLSRHSAQEMRPLSIQPIVKETVKLLKATIPKTIEIKTDIDSECGLVMADPTQIHQIIMNLATNAYHAMQDQGGQLTIALDQIEPKGYPAAPLRHLTPGSYIRLKVIDTGTGIKAEYLHKIFDPYFTTKKQGKGTGLGLSVVQGIVRKCRGDITVHSEEGQGTEVHIYLPVIQEPAGPLPDHSQEPIQTGEERILLVDDEEAIVKMEQEMLTRLGYAVTSATSSQVALEMFRADPHGFDLVITDMTMPNMTGAQMAREILSTRPDIPVIICTGFSERISQEQALNMGIKSFLLKPVVKSDLARTVRKVLDDIKAGLP